MLGGTVFVKSLQTHGVQRVYCVAGESYVTVLDALLDSSIDVVVCRHEGGAAMMAGAQGRLTGAPGIAMVSRGPGATNAALGVYNSQQDGFPMVLVIGHVPRHEMGRGAFQEIDYPSLFGSVAKEVIVITEPERISQAFARAFRVAATPRPGPVVLVVPVDVFAAETPDLISAPQPIARRAPVADELERARDLLRASARPIVIAGEALQSADARDTLQRFAKAFDVPVMAGCKQQHVYPNDDPRYVGYLGFTIPAEIRSAIQRSDLVVAVGDRLDDVTTGRWTGTPFPAWPHPAQPLVHVYADASEIGRDYETALGIACDPVLFMQGMLEQPESPKVERAEWIGALRTIERSLAPWTPRDLPDGIDLGHVVAFLQERLEDDAIIVTDAGNFSSWLHRHYRFVKRQFLLGNACGAMGLGVPGSIAAALAAPSRRVISLIGDGGLLMTGSELTIAAERNLKICFIVANNKCYGTIRAAQERQFPGRVVGTNLSNPDFGALAAAYGLRALRIRQPGEVRPVMSDALAADGPVLVEVQTSTDLISAYNTIQQLRDATQVTARS